jgi:hypothetical protein
MNSYSTKVVGYAGHRARDPPDPIPNSEVKPRSVSGVSVVFGHAKPGKLAAPLPDYAAVYGREILKLYYQLCIVYFEEKNQ